MTHLTHSTTSAKSGAVKRDWHLIDASGKILGRITPMIATYLSGKHKTTYASYMDCGDYVVVVNARKVKISGQKASDKIYLNYSGYPGGLKKKTFAQLLVSKPEYIISHAVSGMLAKNKMRDKKLTRLYIYADDKHPYQDKFK